MMNLMDRDNSIERDIDKSNKLEEVSCTFIHLNMTTIMRREEKNPGDFCLDAPIVSVCIAEAIENYYFQRFWQ